RALRCATILRLFHKGSAAAEIYTLSLHDALPIWFESERGYLVPAVEQALSAEVFPAPARVPPGPSACYNSGEECSILMPLGGHYGGDQHRTQPCRCRSGVAGY